MKKLYIIILLFNAIVLFSQDVELNLVNAKDEFKWGVKFYNQGLYEKSVFSFEKSLSFNSVDNLTHMWLGRAYYMKGDIEAALKEWSQLSDNGNAPLWLDSSIDIISSDLGVASRLYKASEWVPLYSKDFSRPTSILPLDDGGIIIVSFLSDTVIKMNANGGIVSKFDGGFEPFNRPFDIILDSNDGYIVSEFMGDKVSFVNNLGIKTKSVEPDDIPFAGPQYLTKESDRYFYVSDWGNKRVCKFDMDGNYILSISHDLLKGPAGVLVIGDNIYVADQINKTLLLFDSSGNYIVQGLS
ncbi:MAG: hypothetical protein B6229_00620 [Spirochaetaceae bacterium 4572_7]|nr:MAG: hypothetical protein B6229_00620 [Spirochaetaceae bacterium 4572_7]